MAEDRREPQEHEITLDLPAAAKPRLEKVRAEAEIRFVEGVRKVIPSGRRDPTDRKISSLLKNPLYL